MRLFLALELSDEVLAAIDAAVAPLREIAPELKWVAPEKLHLTLRFVGPGDDALVERLSTAIDRIASRERPFTMQLNGIGAFPNFRRARVVWIGVEAAPRLELLHHDVEVACGEAGLELDGRPFRPHVTLARARTPLDVDRARALARASRGVAFSAPQEVAAITLFDSVPGSTGARYRRVHVATFGGR